MAHYVCTGGCEGVSEEGGSCSMKSCMRVGKPLTLCNCTDGQHKEAYRQEKLEEEKHVN